MGLRMAASKTYEARQAALCDCGHDYPTHEKSLRGKLICVYRDPRTDDPCYCDAFTITMKKVRKAHRRVKKSRATESEVAKSARIPSQWSNRANPHGSINLQKHYLCTGFY